MSRAVLRRTIAPLPYKLRDDVLSYATFVEEIAPERAAELDVELSQDQRDQVVLLAGILYVGDLVAGQLALAETATGHGSPYAANMQVRGLRLGTEELRRSSPYIRRLRNVRNQLNRLLVEANVGTTTSRLSDVILLIAESDES